MADDQQYMRGLLDPAAFVRERLGLRPDPLQTEILRSSARRGILCCTRQWGKSTITAAKAFHLAYTAPDQTILIAAPTERQSAELLAKCRQFLKLLEEKPRGDGHNRASLLFSNGSRIVALPHEEQNIRGFSAPALILIDEAACVPDDLYLALSPMLAVSDGALWAMSTPRGKQGFFYREWVADNGWAKFSATALHCPRIPKQHLAEQAARLPKAFFEQEYLCSFHSNTNALFAGDDLQAAQRLEPNLGYPMRVYLGLDLGQRADHAALTVLYLYEINTGQRDPYSASFIVRHVLQLRQLTRIPLGTPYPEIARQVRNTLKHPDLQGRSTLIIDAGGPGLPFIDFLRTEPLNASLIKLVITGSGSPHHTQDQYVVSRAHLLTNLALLLEQKVLQLPVNDDLITELQAIQTDFSTKAAHDDLAMSLAMAAWQATRTWRGVLARTIDMGEPSASPR